MYFQFLIEDGSTSILVNHVMEKLAEQYRDKEIIWNVKFFGGVAVCMFLCKRKKYKRR